MTETNDISFDESTIQQPTDQRITKLTQYAQHLIMNASELQTSISASKTQAKRAFYQKKMRKVRAELTQVLSTMELLKLTTTGTGYATRASATKDSTV